MLSRRLRRGDIGKFYYFPRRLTSGISPYLTLNSGVEWDGNVTSVLLCMRKALPRSQPQLTLYLRAIRGASRRYISLQLPVDLKLETSKRTAEVSTRVDDVKDEQPPRKRLKVDATSEKLLKDGFYIHPLMTMDVETRGDGRQRVLLTSVTDELDSVSLAEAWLAPAEEYPTTGCLELRGALPTARICPHGDNEVILIGLGNDKTLIFYSPVPF